MDSEIFYFLANSNFLVHFCYYSELYLVLLLYSVFSEKSKNFFVTFFVFYFCGAALIFGLSYINFPKIFPDIYDSLCFFIFIFVIGPCFKENFKGKVFLATASLATQHGLSLISQIIYYFVGEGPYSSFLYIFCEIIVLIFGTIFLLFLFKKVKSKIRSIHFISTRFFIVSIILVASSFIVFNYARISDEVTLSYLIVDLMLSIVAIFVLFSENFVANLSYEKDLIEHIMISERKKYKNLEKGIEAFKRKAHDLKYIEKAWSDDIERPKNFNVGDDYQDSFDDIVLTGNSAIDSVLTEKALYCKKHDIKFSYIVDISNLEFISNVDIYVLLGNLLDNSIECVINYKDKEKRIISLNISSKLNFLSIVDENYCEEKVTFLNGFPKTNKKDHNNHGIGVKSISYIVKKYNGNMVMSSESKLFSTKILIPVDK